MFKEYRRRNQKERIKKHKKGEFKDKHLEWQINK
jgi:hypothetical protein